VKDELVLSQLEGLAYKLGIAIRYDKVIRDESSGRGGLCRIQGDYVLFIDSQATTKEKIRVSIEALKQFNLADIHIKPAIRDLLEGSKE
jgi:hypothetical protein